MTEAEALLRTYRKGYILVKEVEVFRSIALEVSIDGDFLSIKKYAE